MSIAFTQFLVATLAVVSLATGAFFLISWVTRRDRRIYRWLANATLLGGAGCSLLLLRGTGPDVISIWLANALILSASGQVWALSRRFDDRPCAPLWIYCGAIVWTACCLVPPFYGNLLARTFLVSCITGIYYALSSYEILRRYPQDRIVSRLVAATLTSIHAITSLSRIILVFNAKDQELIYLFQSPMIGLYLLEGIVGVTVLALAFTVLERDRAELNQMTAASTDVLTGTLSRRGFLNQAAAWVETACGDAAIILFDLDHFKRINDSHGHAAGDMALIAFARIVQRRLGAVGDIAAFNRDSPDRFSSLGLRDVTTKRRPPAQAPLFGRLGGEEFACLLPAVSQHQAALVADDIRRAVASANIRYNGERIAMTVSAGVVSTAETGHWLHTMMVAADFALYRAKHNGRDRVETSTEDGIAHASRVVA